jgi:myo-inositol-1(or 4)-monophosphatase
MPKHPANVENPILTATCDAAAEAGALIRRHLHSPKRLTAAAAHDLKLELDERCQQLLARRLRRIRPDAAILGEEGRDHESAQAEFRWVVDPIDGTVNFAHAVPHACVSVALQQRTAAGPVTLLGVVLDPFQNECWAARRGRPATRNGRPIRVSARARLAEAMVSAGLAKSGVSLRRMLPVFNRLARRARKVRMMGSAALSLAYVADGRFDGYVESGLRLWDIAAGALLVECAGGTCELVPLRGDLYFELQASNGRIHRELARAFRAG